MTIIGRASNHFAKKGNFNASFCKREVMYCKECIEITPLCFFFFFLQKGSNFIAPSFEKGT